MKTKTAALITAAGAGGEINRFKPMLDVGNETILEHSITVLRETGIDEIVVITGYQESRLRRFFENEEITFLRNENYADSDMFSSVCIGLEYLENHCSRVLINPADVPLLSPEPVRALLKHSSRYNSNAAVPVYEGEPGHPIVISTGIIPCLLGSKTGGGLKAALKGCTERIEYIETEDPAVLLDINTMQEYRDLLNLKKREQTAEGLRADVRLELSGIDMFFSSDTARFLSLTDRCGSMQTASGIMNLSYSKCWKMLKAAEANTGFQLLSRTAGGAEGGKSELTSEGRKFLAAYQSLQNELDSRAKKLFREHFSKWL